MENQNPEKIQEPEKATPREQASEKGAGSTILWTGFVLLIAGFIALWQGSTVAAPFLIIFGYLAVALGLLW